MSGVIFISDDLVFLFLSSSCYTMFRFVVLFFLHNVLTFFCFCSFSGQCWPVAVVCVPPQERRLRPFKALWHRHLPAKQMYSSSWSSSSSSSSSSWSSSSSSSSPSSKQEYSSRGHRPGASISSVLFKPLHEFVNSNTLVLGALVTPKLKWVPQVITSTSVTSEWFLTRVTSTGCSS